MKKFNYIKPKSIAEVKSYFTSTNSVLTAGGTDILGLVKKEVHDYENLIDLKSLPNLDFIKEETGKGITIGALTKISAIADNKIVKEKYTALAEAAGVVASPQLRNMGTIAGNICQRPRCWYYRDDYNCLRKEGSFCFAEEGENKYHAVIGGMPCYIVHPSDTAVALMALDAQLTIVTDKDERTISINDFFVLPDEDVYKENILAPHEVITKIFIPEQANKSSKFIKFAEREVWDFAMASIAVCIEKSGSKISDGKIVLGGVAPKPWVDAKLNQFIKGLSLDENSIEKIANIALEGAEPLNKNSYKILLARNLIKMALSEN